MTPHVVLTALLADGTVARRRAQTISTPGSVEAPASVCEVVSRVNAFVRSQTEGSTMLTLAQSAVEAVDTLLHNPEVPDDAGLRIDTGGESRFTIEIVSEPAPGDEVIEEGGARVFVDSEAAPMLDDAELHARREGDQVAFGLAPAGGGS